MFSESRSQLIQAQQKMMDSERKTATYMKRHNKVQVENNEDNKL